MFQLTEEEIENMVSQNAIPSRKHLGGSLPYAFTEHGVLMLANVLKNKTAIQISIRVIEIFVKLREMLLYQTKTGSRIFKPHRNIEHIEKANQTIAYMLCVQCFYVV
jgi:hypothetical protein